MKTKLIFLKREHRRALPSNYNHQKSSKVCRACVGLANACVKYTKACACVQNKSKQIKLLLNCKNVNLQFYTNAFVAILFQIDLF